MPLQTRNIGRIPVYFGDYVPGRAYQEKHRVTLYGSEFQAAKDNPLKAPLTYDTSTNKIIEWNVVNGDHASPTGEWYIISNGTDALIASRILDNFTPEIIENLLNFEEYVSDIEKQIEVFNSDLSNIGTIAESANNKADECVSDISDIEKQIEVFNSDLSNIGTIAESANNKADECASDISDINNRIEAVNSDLSNIGTIAESANNKVDECASDISDIEKRIEALENNARITLSVSPSIIYRNVKSSITIRATAYGFTPETFSITYNNQEIASEKGKTSVVTTIDASSSVTLSAKATYGGKNYTSSASVKAVGAIYYGFMNETENVTKKLSPRTSALGNYQLESTLDNAKFFIMIPHDMSFPSSITMGGTPYVMDMTETEKDGEAYYLLTSGATYNTGAEINIKLS